VIAGHINDDMSMDWEAALEAAQMRPDLCEAAAQARIEELVSLWIANNGIPGSVVNDPAKDFKAEVRRIVRQDHPALAATADDGEAIDEDALRETFWMK
jgi:hypothetical protein